MRGDGHVKDEAKVLKSSRMCKTLKTYDVMESRAIVNGSSMASMSNVPPSNIMIDLRSKSRSVVNPIICARQSNFSERKHFTPSELARICTRDLVQHVHGLLNDITLAQRAGQPKRWIEALLILNGL